MFVLFVLHVQFRFMLICANQIHVYMVVYNVSTCMKADIEYNVLAIIN